MGRIPCENRERKYNIQKLWDIHHEILRLTLLGMKSVDIANLLGITTATVSYTQNSPISKRQLSIMRGARDANTLDVAKTIQELQPKAVQRLSELMESETEAISLKAAMTLLDRGGNAPVQRIQADHRHVSFTLDEIQAIKDRAKQAVPTISYTEDTEEASFEEVQEG